MSKAEKSEEKQICVSGFLFDNEAEAQKAQKEADGVAYIRSKTDMDTPEMVLQIYNKMIEQDVFETVVGYAYLKELQEYLKSIPFIDQERVLTIPVSHSELDESIREELLQERRLAEKERMRRQERARAVPKKVTYVNVDYKRRYRVAAGTCIALALCVLGMFFVTSTTNNATILNYENQIINKYEAWEQELNEREKALEEQEGQDDGQN